MRILLAAGADVDMAMTNGRTALHIVAGKNNTVIADMLIQHGCKVSIHDYHNHVYFV